MRIISALVIGSLDAALVSCDRDLQLAPREATAERENIAAGCGRAKIRQEFGFFRYRLPAASFALRPSLCAHR
jgi:hypothetical protein